MTTSFRDLGVDAALCDALEARGITHAFPIQERSLPMALAGHDVIGQARTGTGKTLAFGLPLLQRLDPSVARTQALVIVPTRELCIQVADELAIGAGRGLSSIAIYGGVPYDDQVAAVTSGVHVVVGTPGRLLDLLQRGDLRLGAVTELVLDEADEMLDMGFLPDVERLIEACGTPRHGMLFSATMPTEVVRIARRYLTDPTFVRADHEVVTTAPNVTQHFLQVHRLDKPRILARILQSPGRGGVYVFVRTKMKADRLVEELAELGVEAIAIHGDLRQTTRERNLDRFREGRATVLVATEVAARGLDVDGVTHVVNYDCPEDEKMYLHRIGRTARAGASGVAVTFAEHNEVERLTMIRKAVDQLDNEIEPVFSTSPTLVTRFDLPEETPWASRRTAPGAPSGGGRGATASGRRGEGGRSRAPRDTAAASDGPGPREPRATAATATATSTANDEADGDGRDDDPTARTGGRGRSRGRRGRGGTTRADVTSDVTSTEAPSSTPTSGPDRPAARPDGGTAPAPTGDAPTTRTRTRTRARPATAAAEVAATPASATRDPDADAGGSPSPTSPRPRSRARRPSTDRADAPTGRDAGDDAGSTGTGRRRGGGGDRGRTDEGGARQGAGRTRSATAGRRDGDGSGDRGQRDAGRGGRREQDAGSRGRTSRGSGGTSGRDRGARTEADPGAVRGAGQPQATRRVRIEHLP